MASIRERRSAATKATTYAVLFRDGGRQTSITFTDKKAAERFRAVVDALGPKAALEATKVRAETGLTVAELFEKWIDWKRTTGVTGRTIRDYRRDYTNWIKPRLGHRHADSLDELDVQAWVDWMGQRLDPKSVGDRHMILGSMYRYGVARSRRLVEHNPCAETQLPAKRKKAPKGFTLVQWEAMQAWAAEHEPDAGDLLLFLAATGWRFSEATPVTAAAIDDMGDVVVDGRVVPVVFVSVLGVHRIDETDRRVYAEGEAKSHAGTRRINLPPEAALMVRRRMVGKGPSDLLFTAPGGRAWRSSNFLEREFARILAGAGIEKVKGMGPHYLRHTHVAMLDRAQVSLAKTQRRIGHESISTTIGVYGGMIDNSLSADELLRLDAMLSPREPAEQIVAGEIVRGEIG